MKEKILTAIKDYIKQHGYPPSFREIGDMVGLQSTSSVQKYIKKMLELGVLETDHPGMARAIRVPGMVAGYELDKVLETLDESCYWTDATYDEDGYSNDDSWEVIDKYEVIRIVRSGWKEVTDIK